MGKAGTAASTASSRMTDSASTRCATRPNGVHPSAFILQPFPAVLIDGETLSDLMIDYNIGVSVAETYLVKKVDLDFFNEEGE
jgi:hypothetical protein